MSFVPGISLVGVQCGNEYDLIVYYNSHSTGIWVTLHGNQVPQRRFCACGKFNIRNVEIWTLWPVPWRKSDVSRANSLELYVIRTTPNSRASWVTWTKPNTQPIPSPSTIQKTHLTSLSCWTSRKKWMIFLSWTSQDTIQGKLQRLTPLLVFTTKT